MIKLARLLRRFLFWVSPWFSADYRQLKRNRVPMRCPCPACGAVDKHRIRFDAAQKLVVRQCVVCLCEWGYEPLVKPQKYIAPPSEEQA